MQNTRDLMGVVDGFVDTCCRLQAVLHISLTISHMSLEGISILLQLGSDKTEKRRGVVEDLPLPHLATKERVEQPRP